jgi:hypothetical protein
MTHDQTRIRAAIERTFAEVNNAILKLTAYNALAREDITYAGMSLFVIIENALFNDMVANAMRALDEHRDAASFWYICRCDEPLAERAAKVASVQLSGLRATSAKLRHVREKTHFHVDRGAVANPADVWSNAGITGNDFTTALHAVASVVSTFEVERFGGEPLELAKYDGSDVTRIVGAFEQACGHAHGIYPAR